MSVSNAINHPHISVLMSCYNAERWVNEAIESVLAQTISNIELILVDDGSVDDTPNILHKYRKIDKRVIVISKEHTGLADSLNVGKKHANGTWIARLDADDLCEPTRLEEQITFADSHPGVVLLGSGATEIDEEGRFLRRHIYPSDHSTLMRHLKRSKRFFPHSSAFFRSDVFDDVGGYHIGFFRAEDKQLWFELSLTGKLASVPKPLVRIRRHSGQISKENEREQLRDNLAAIICHVLNEAGFVDPSSKATQEEWSLFLKWIAEKIEHEGDWESRRVWTEARLEYLGARKTVLAAMRYFCRLSKTRHFLRILWEKLAGSTLPMRLASEWNKRAESFPKEGGEFAHPLKVTLQQKPKA